MIRSFWLFRLITLGDSYTLSVTSIECWLVKHMTTYISLASLEFGFSNPSKGSFDSILSILIYFKRLLRIKPFNLILVFNFILFLTVSAMLAKSEYLKSSSLLSRFCLQSVQARYVKPLWRGFEKAMMSKAP
jgi:hypothetical protein